MSAYFHPGSPIYSAYAVVFKIGHPRYPIGLDKSIADGMARDYMVGDAQFKWTYTSPMFPMSQVSCVMEIHVLHNVFYYLKLLNKMKAGDSSSVFFLSCHHLFIYVIPVLV